MISAVSENSHGAAGDADYICNYMGFEAVVNALNTTMTPTLQQQEFATWTVAGQDAGVYKNAGMFSYVRVKGAGHEVPAYSTGTRTHMLFQGREC
jgi:carboxypeptidase C (cathepsin A)